MCIPSSTNEDITTISDIIGLELDWEHKCL
jgi:hypothetical protein